MDRAKVAKEPRVERMCMVEDNGWLGNAVSFGLCFSYHLARQGHLLVSTHSHRRPFRSSKSDELVENP